MIYLITGGARSGKSSYAQNLAKSLTDFPLYLATSNEKDDEEFQARVNRHKKDRGEEWDLLEVPLRISEVETDRSVILVDCVTLWLNNFFSKHQYDSEISLGSAKQELNQIQKSKTWIFVTNEIGLGLHADSEIGRAFVDLHGWMNQHIAEQADEVTMMVSGIPLKLKPVE
ncbi:MAG: bifunctional adenosylcobinamide kinase/adenosylcobinamide-phosphate guanylyltransferase [Bacteroidota bacterium]